MASGHPALIEAMQRGLAQMVGTSSGYLEGLPAPVRTRIEYLDALQEEYDELEDKFEREVREIEEKYKKLYSKSEGFCTLFQRGRWSSTRLVVLTAAWV
jgi:hypothetical protein